MVLVFDNDNIKYNIILSANLLSKTGFKSNWSERTWNGLITPSHFVHLEELDSNKFDVMKRMLHIQLKDEIFGEDWLKSLVTKILDAKYNKTDVAEVMKGLTHLHADQKQTYFKCYRKTKKMFDETLDVYPLKRFSKKDDRVRLISNSRQSKI
jgi:hypothetical protein